MSNHEKYKKTFSVLEPSDNLLLEVKRMKKSKYFIKNIAAAACAMIILAVGSTSIAYAADIGGFRQTVNMWFHGKNIEGTVETLEEGTYSVTYTDENGEIKSSMGGGVATGEDGVETPISAEEYMDNLNSSPTLEEKDGKYTLYYKDQIMDVTEEFKDSDEATIVLYDGAVVILNKDGSYSMTSGDSEDESGDTKMVSFD